MNRTDVEKLLGGYATGTLTPDEKRRLFEAALKDQALFNALADEQGLKALLDDPRARRTLLARLQQYEASAGPFARVRTWLASSNRPSWPIAASLAGVAVLVLAVVAVTRLYEHAGRPPAPRPAKVEPQQPRPAEAKKEEPAPLADRPASPKAVEPVPPLGEGRGTAPAERPLAAAPRREPAPTPRRRDEPAAGVPSSEAPRASALVQPAESERTGGAGARIQVAQGPARAAFYSAATEIGTAAAPSNDAADERLNKPAQGLSASPAPRRGDGAPPAAGRLNLTSKTAAAHSLAMRYQTLDEAGVAIQVNQAAFLYVFARDASHDWRRLFPAEEAEAAVERGARYVIPVPLPAEAGADRRVVAIVTRKARPELLSEAADPLAIPIDPGLFIHETAEEAAGDGTSRPTTYLAERHAGSTPILVADVTLPHP